MKLDVRGDIYGILAAHPVALLVSHCHCTILLVQGHCFQVKSGGLFKKAVAHIQG
ncbi:hypothetical protein SOVF_065810 [Spinacia oleracea]|nr:hypothetical protein SOVF_065810 [Spinacia oleracea]